MEERLGCLTCLSFMRNHITVSPDPDSMRNYITVSPDPETLLSCSLRHLAAHRMKESVHADFRVFGSERESVCG